MVQIAVDQIVEAAGALSLAGRWDTAEQLLAAARTGTAAERAVLAMAAAELAVEADFWRRTTTAGPALELAARELAAAKPAGTEPTGADAGARGAGLDRALELLRLRHDYFAELFGPDGPRFGLDDRDMTVTGELADRARRLRDTAPDRGGAGQAAFWAGVIEDNLRGDSTSARPLFTQALAAGEESGDDLLVSEALRHLGYLNHQSGQPDLAREQWQRATSLRQRSGCVPYTLAQQLLIAEMAVADGDTTARPQIEEIRRWAKPSTSRSWSPKPTRS